MDDECDLAMQRFTERVMEVARDVFGGEHAIPPYVLVMQRPDNDMQITGNIVGDEWTLRALALARNSILNGRPDLVEELEAARRERRRQEERKLRARSPLLILPPMRNHPHN